MTQKFGSLIDVAAALLPQRGLYYTPSKPHTARFLAGMSVSPRKPFLTCTGKTDGGGAQVQAVMSVLAFCHAFGYRYVHSPFHIIEHTKGPGEIAAWEKLFGLGTGEMLISDMTCPILPSAVYMRSPRLWLRRTVVQVEYLHPYVDLHPESYLAIRDMLRRKYTGAPVLNDPGALTVAVHIRRGDVSQSAHHIRYTGNEEIAVRVRAIRAASAAAGRPCRFILHSQGSPQDFAELAREGCELRLNADPLASFNELVHADILVMAKSSFSYVAGILSRGIILYEPFWCAPLPGWIDAADPTTLAEKLKSIVP